MAASAPFEPIDDQASFRRWAPWFDRMATAGADLDLPTRMQYLSDTPTVLVANHRSLFDLAVAMTMFHRFAMTSRILVRADLMEHGPAARILRNIGCIPTSSSTRASAEAASIESIRRGQLVSLMPEGRLCGPKDWVNGVGPGRSGISRIALATGAVVVPVAISGTEAVWPPGKPPKVGWPRPRVSLRLGPTIELTGDDHHKNAELVMAGLSSTLEKMGDRYAVRPARLNPA